MPRKQSPITPSWSRHPDRGGIGTNSDPASRRRALQEAEADVAYRRQLLEDLDEGKA
jgi:hypothetical protein